MSSKHYMRPTANGLVPVGDDAVKAYEKLLQLSRQVDNMEVAVGWDKSRNWRQHRLLFAAMQRVYKAIEHKSVWKTFNGFRGACMVATGHCDVAIRPDGSEMAIPHSLSASECPPEQFEVIFDDLVKLMCEKFIPSLDTETQREVYTILDGVPPHTKAA